MTTEQHRRLLYPVFADHAEVLHQSFGLSYAEYMVRFAMSKLASDWDEPISEELFTRNFGPGRKSFDAEDIERWLEILPSGPAHRGKVA